MTAEVRWSDGRPRPLATSAAPSRTGEDAHASIAYSDLL